MARTTKAAAAVDRKAAAESGKKDPNQQLLDALKFERAGYVTRKLTDRVKQVDAQIKQYGGAAPTTRTAPAQQVPEADAAPENDEAAADDAGSGDPSDTK